MLDRSQTDTRFPWFALQVKSRHEKAVSLALRSKGYVEFLPLYHRQSSSNRSSGLPLFPTYVFCRFDPCQRLPILMTPGVFSIVGTRKSLLAVDEAELSAVQRTVELGLRAEPLPFTVGDSVRIEAGPLRGTHGILQRTKNQDRLVVSISLLQRSIAIEMDPSWLTQGRPNGSATPGQPIYSVA